MNRSRVWPRLVLFAGLSALALAFAAALAGFEPADEGGVLSSKATGRRAAYQLLQDNGHRVIAWQQAPGDLANVEGLLLVGEDVKTSGEASTDRGSDDPRSGEHYREFMESGGRAIVDAHAREWLTDQVGLELSEAKFGAPATSGEVLSPAGEAFAIDSYQVARLPCFVDGLPGTSLISADDGRPFAALYPVGEGALLLVGDTELWRNSSIARADHAYLLIALVGMIGGERTVMFDEYARGRFSPPGFISMTFRGRVAPFGWTLLLWLALMITASIWTWRFPRDPRAKDDVHPFQRVRSGARLLERARRPVDIAARLRAAVMTRLARRFRRPEAGEFAADQLLTLAVSRADSVEIGQVWREALAGRLPVERKPLEHWAAQLLEIERAVDDSLRRESQGGVGRSPREQHG